MAKRFGAYEILYELKTGGMGAVLLGRRRGPGAFEQLVAIKTILAEHAQSQAVRAMFLDEAAILARLNHPGVATVHDFGEDGGTLYMVMEYVAGISLRDAMALAMPPTVAARAIIEACRGLHAAHELRDLAGLPLGLVHRDISPDNLLLGFDGHAKVIDFGIALIKGRQAPVTEFGMVKGKPPYMSPEQVKNAPLDRRSDVFSLGVVLWELLAGRGLFDGDSIYAIARAVEHQDIPPPSRVRGEALPLGLDAAVMNALDRDVDRRTQTAAAFAEELEAVIQAAGDETLAAWAARVLAQPRAEHRAWLASVVHGEASAPRPGRASGAVTALSPAQQVSAPSTMAAPTAPPMVPPSDPPVDPYVATYLPPAAAEAAASSSAPSSRRLRGPVIVGLLALGVVGSGIAVLRSKPEARAVTAIVDAGADARGVDAAIAIDAAVDAPVDAAVDAPADARIDAPPRDAGPHRARPRELPRDVPRDASPVEPPAAAIPAGIGKLVAKHTGDTYLGVLIDGSFYSNTPVLGEAIASGRHVIELVDVQTRKVVARRVVVVHPGETVTITP